MCGGAKPPKPVAPPAPIPERDSNIESVRKRQSAAGKEAQSGFSATMLTGPEGATGPVTSPTLGG